MLAHRSWRLAPAVGTLAALAACSDMPAPVAPVLTTPAPSASVAPASVAEGELWICKTANASGTFSFNYSLVNDLGAAGPSGTVSVDAGTCVMATAVDKVTVGPSNRWFATVTEAAPPAYWSLTGIVVTYTGNFNNSPVVDLANRTVSRIRVANDLGGTATFTNAYTPPTGKIGDYVWNDLNGNGIQEAGEPGIAGVSVTLGGAASASTTTDANGYYLFSGLAAGSYTVTAATPTGLTPTLSNQGGDPALDSNGSPASVTLATDSSEDLTIDFGFVLPPAQGCTYTQGYWKTHSRKGPAPYDAGWQNLGALEENTPFFASGKTWYQMWQQPVRGSAYIQLAHQYMAAKLNVLNGASAPANVTAAMVTAESYFGGASVNIKGLASLLDDYNNGRTGPGHCD